MPVFGLMHMNGRLYDPQVGRMLSADNNVQDPANGQNYNRYSYVMNNPLKYTDPTGELYAGYDGGLHFTGRPIEYEFNRNQALYLDGELIGFGDGTQIWGVSSTGGVGGGIYNNLSKQLTIDGHEFKLRVHGFSDRVPESYYEIHQAGFGYLDRYSSFTPSSKYNSGYYQGFYMTGYDKQYFITIGANSNAGYDYLRNLYNSFK
jgi:RHS repeat-associated protein